MTKILKYLILIVFLAGCSTFPPDWIIDANHAVSPDGKAYIYQSTFVENDSVRISVGTWIKTPIGKGGAGIFDLISTDNHILELKWLSDSVVVIKYPINSRILRMNKSAFFGGRQTTIRYEMNN